jgi:hypothetical protein
MLQLSLPSSKTKLKKGNGKSRNMRKIANTRMKSIIKKWRNGAQKNAGALFQI